MTLLFQYGSNASERRINSDDRLKGDAKPIGAFETDGTYRLEFTVWSKKNKCAAANLAPAPGRRVWGIVYDVPDHLMSSATSGERRSMEAIEGSRYRQEPIELLDLSGLLGGRPVVTYVARDPTLGLLTSLEYVAHIVFGLWSFGVPADYLDYVKECVVANNPELAGGVAAL